MNEHVGPSELVSPCEILNLEKSMEVQLHGHPPLRVVVEEVG